VISFADDLCCEWAKAKDSHERALVQAALDRMASKAQMQMPYAVTIAHYATSGVVKRKAAAMGISVRTYWEHLHSAHVFIIACDVPRGTEVCAQNLACA
jgi:hypothetical protein